jgi:hypothetical protein
VIGLDGVSAQALSDTTGAIYDCALEPRWGRSVSRGDNYMQSESPVLQESDCAQLGCRRSNIGRQSMGRRSQDIDFAVRKLFAPSLGTYVAKRAVARIRSGARTRRRLFCAEVYWGVRS